MNEETTSTETEETQYTGTATYCPEDNKLRLYIGRVPRDEYLALRAEGWKALHKQREAGQGDFVATWTPERRDTALRYAGCIDDEDAGPEERAADRAERFAGYCEKREAEAGGHADKFESGPAVHGYQNRARAVRAADRHDRSAGRAVDAWEKAEYWQRRTAGVISHRLYLSSPAVRMGRIKDLEANIRRTEKSREEYESTRNLWLKCQAETDVGKQDKLAARLAYVEHGDYINPHSGRKRYLFDFSAVDVDGDAREGVEDPCTGAELCALYLSRHGPLAPEGPWLTHFRLRLAYENQMLEAQGGRAAFVEMEAGGWLGNRQIQKVNKSNATGRVVSVELRYMSETDKWGNAWRDGKGARMLSALINVERLAANAYRAPTDEERAKFLADKKQAAKVASAERAGVCPLINPTDDDAERLQELWNEKAKEAAHRQKVVRMTQAQYSARSQGTFCSCGTVTVCETGYEHRSSSMCSQITRHDVFKVRKTSGEGDGWNRPDRVIVITDKPQKAIPWAALEKARALCPSEESMWDKLPAIKANLSRSWLSDMDEGLMNDARYVGWVSIQSMSQVYWTEKGAAAMKEFEAEDKRPAVVAASAPVVAPVSRVAVSAVDAAPRVQAEFCLS